MAWILKRRRTAKRIRKAIRLKRYLSNPSVWKIDTSGDLTNGMRVIRRKRKRGGFIVVPTHTYSNRAVLDTLYR